MVAAPSSAAGNPFAHDVADDDVETDVAMVEEVVEVAVNALRWNGQRRGAHAGQILRRLLEQQRLLDLEADLDFLLARPGELLLRALAVGDVLGDAHQILGRAVGPEDGHLDGVEIAQAAVGRLDRFFGDVDHPSAGQHRTVLGLEESRLLVRKEVVVALADGRAAIDPERLFLGPVPAHEPQVLGIFDEQHDREMLEHGVQKVPGLLELGGAARQRLLGAAVLRKLAFQLGVGVARTGGVVAGAAAVRLRAVEDAVDAWRSEEYPPDSGTPGRQRAKRQDGSSAARSPAASRGADSTLTFPSRSAQARSLAPFSRGASEGAHE